MEGSHSLRQAALVSRVSFEPLSLLDQQNGLARDGSGVSAQSDSEFEAWRVRAAASEDGDGPGRPAPLAAPPAVRRHLPAGLLMLGLGKQPGQCWCMSLPFVSLIFVPCHSQEEHPCALHSFDQIASLAANKLVAIFLDYDGAAVFCFASSVPSSLLMQQQR